MQLPFPTGIFLWGFLHVRYLVNNNLAQSEA